MVTIPISPSAHNTKTIKRTLQQNTNTTVLSGREYHQHNLPALTATRLQQEFRGKDPRHREEERSKSIDSCHEERFSNEHFERFSNASMTSASRTSTDNSQSTADSMAAQGESRNYQAQGRVYFSTISRTTNLAEITERTTVVSKDDCVGTASPKCSSGSAIAHQLRVCTGDRKNDLASLALSNGNHLINAAHDQHSQSPHDHHHHLYEPVVHGTEDEAQALAEEATAAVYAKEVLGPPEDADGSEVQVEEELLNVLPPAVKRPRLNMQSATARGNLHCSVSERLHPNHHYRYKFARSEISSDSTTNTATYAIPNLASSPPYLVEKHCTSSVRSPTEMTQQKVIQHSTAPSSASTVNGSKKVHNEQWNEMLERLKTYKAIHGDCLVPKRYQSDPKLGTWVETQRVQYKRLSRVFSSSLGYEVPQPNKRLTAERLNKLEELGFCWSAKHIRKSNSTAAANTVTTMSRALGTNNIFNVTSKTIPTVNPIPSVDMDKFHVGLAHLESVSESRTGGSTTCSTSVGGMTNSNGAVDSASSRTSLPDQCRMNTPVVLCGKVTSAASDRKYSPDKVGQSSLEKTSLSVQTEMAGIASQPRDTESESLPSDATVHQSLAQNSSRASGACVQPRCNNSDVQWDIMYQRLLQYHQKHGDCLVPRKYPADPKLASWVDIQRVLWNRDFNSSGRVGNDLSNPSTTAQTSSSTSSKRAATSIGVLSLEGKQKLDRLGFVWSLRNKRIDDHWDEMFRQLVEYKNEHGDCLVPSRYLANLKLGKWVETQRYEYTKLKRATSISSNNDATKSEISDERIGSTKPSLRYFNASCHPASTDAPSLPRPINPRLTPERLRRLESIGFEWKVKNKMKRYYDKQWDGMFQRLLDFKKQYGHVNVPKRFPDDLKLGTWVHTQRIQYRKLMAGKSSQKKAACGAQTTIPTRIEADTGSSSVPTGSNAFAVGPRIMNTATQDQHGEVLIHSDQVQTFRLTEERRHRLEKVGFCWSAREGGTATLIAETRVSGLSMTNCNATGNVGGSREAILMAGRMTRNSYDDQWDVMFQLLEQYKAQNGDCLVPKRYPLNPKLGTWVDTQRVQYKKLQKKIAQIRNQHQELQQQTLSPAQSIDHITDGKTVSAAPKTMPPVAAPLVGRLTQERIQRLQNLGFVWSLRDDWAKHYEELKVFKQKAGHCNVPARFAENRRLGIWVSAQRQQYKILQQQKHLQEVAAAAAALEVASTCSQDTPSKIKGETGHSLTVGSKVRRSTPLTQERIDLLNAIGFTWTIRSRDSLGESWNQRLLELRRFRQEHGHCLVPSRYEANPELGVWVGTQRTQYRLYMRSRESGIAVSTSMNEDRIRELEDLGFVWALRGTLPDETASVPVRADPSVPEGTSDMMMDMKGLGDVHSTQSPPKVPNTDSSSGETNHHHQLLQGIEI